MNIELDDIISGGISDETAYYLVNFMAELTATLESQYFAQMRRYHHDFIELNKEAPDFLKEDF